MESRISGHTKLYCLIGSPVGHSGSPAIYNYLQDRVLPVFSVATSTVFYDRKYGRFADFIADSAFYRTVASTINITLLLNRAFPTTRTREMYKK